MEEQTDGEQAGAGIKLQRVQGGGRRIFQDQRRRLGMTPGGFRCDRRAQSDSIQDDCGGRYMASLGEVTPGCIRIPRRSACFRGMPMQPGVTSPRLAMYHPPQSSWMESDWARRSQRKPPGVIPETAALILEDPAPPTLDTLQFDSPPACSPSVCSSMIAST